MKMPSLIAMPAPAAPASGTLPGMPRDLAAAIDRAQALLNDRSRLSELLTEQNRAASGLLVEKLEAQSNLGHAETGRLLGELSESDVEAAQDAFEEASSAYTSVVQVRQNLRARLLDRSAESALVQARDAIEALRPAFAEQMLTAFDMEYRIAAEQFSRVLARGKSLSVALRVDVPMPAPQPAIEVNGKDDATLADAVRVGSVLDGLNAALNEIQNERQQVEREKRRVLPYSAGQVWRFTKNYEALGYTAGDLVQCPILSESFLERLYQQKYLVAADGSATALEGERVA